MLTIIFAATTVICCIGWLKDHVGLLALCKYLVDHDMDPPTEELHAACKFAVRRMLFKQVRR